MWVITPIESLDQASHYLFRTQMFSFPLKNDAVFYMSYDVAQLNDSEESKAIQLGYEIFMNTPKYIGPDNETNAYTFQAADTGELVAVGAASSLSSFSLDSTYDDSLSFSSLRITVAGSAQS